MFSIPQSYWCEVIAVLITKGYIAGFKVVDYTKSRPQVQTDKPFKITFEGVQFLEENSRMKKEGEVSAEAFNVLLSAIIGAII